MRTLSLVIAGCCLIQPEAVQACAAAPPRGEEVRIAEEEAIIVWDAATKTEHFIRRAAFSSSADAFGFLVPTPSIPKLAEVNSAVFGQLADALAPDVTTQTGGVSFVPTCLLMVSRDAGDTAVTPVVRVVGIEHVAGYQASILQADDAKALAGWLGEHGFEATAELEAWLEPYVRDKWTITAFEVAATTKSSSGPKRASSAAVQMSFATTRPFYPYREPASQQAEPRGKLAGTGPGSRLLRVFFFGDERVDGLLGRSPWSAQVIWSAAVGRVPTALEAIVGSKTRLTVFHDETFPRQGTDEVWFDRAADQAEQRPPAVIETVPLQIPIDLVLLVALPLIGGVAMWRRRWNRR